MSGPSERKPVRAEPFRDTPNFELDLPGQTYHLLALYLRSPEEMGIRTEGLDWTGQPPLALSSFSPLGIRDGLSGAGQGRASTSTWSRN
jgi:hypothetical protein